MRWLLLLAFVPVQAAAEIGSAEACKIAVAADPVAAREDAAAWARTGGGIPARLCEAEALAALGAHGTAAVLLTRLAENPNRAMPAELRAVVLGDAAGQWLDAGRPDLARAVLVQADRLMQPDPDRLLLQARTAAAEADWPAAQAALSRLTTVEPNNPLAHAMTAATLRYQGDPSAALREAKVAFRLAPDLPESLFELAAARAETGDPAGASLLWQRLLAQHPDSDLAAAARANLQAFN